MVQTASLFNQLLHHFPRIEFGALVKETKAERHARGFTCWAQFVSMLFCHLAHADSLRIICNGLSCCLGKLKHLGISEAPSKSGLAYANQHRPAALFQQLFWKALDRFRSQSMLGPTQKPFRFKNKLLLLDSTTISLCLSLFPWAEFKKVKGGVKAHVLLDHDDYMPQFIHFTAASHPDGSSPRWSKQFRTAMTGLAGVSGRNDAQGLLTTTSSEKEPGGHRECAADARWVLAAA